MSSSVTYSLNLALHGKSWTIPPWSTWQSYRCSTEMGMGTQRHPSIQRLIYESTGNSIPYIVSQCWRSRQWREKRRIRWDLDQMQQHTLHSWNHIMMYMASQKINHTYNHLLLCFLYVSSNDWCLTKEGNLWLFSRRHISFPFRFDKTWAIPSGF